MGGNFKIKNRFNQVWFGSYFHLRTGPINGQDNLWKFQVSKSQNGDERGKYLYSLSQVCIDNIYNEHNVFAQTPKFLKYSNKFQVIMK